MTDIYDWIITHPEATIAIVVYVAINVLPRPHPDDRTGWQRTLFWLLDRIAWLTHDKLPGKLKLIFTASPRPAAAKDEGTSQ